MTVRFIFFAARKMDGFRIGVGAYASASEVARDRKVHPMTHRTWSQPDPGLYGAFLVKGVPQGSYPFSCTSVSLFDRAAVSSSRPTTSGVAGARRNGQGWSRPVGGPPEGLGP